MADILTLGTPPDGARIGRLLTADYTALINATATMTVTERPVAGLPLTADAMAMLCIMVKGGNAGCALAITLTLEVSPDGGTNWFELDPISVNLSGTATVTKALLLDIAGMAAIRLGKVANAETSSGYTALVNAYIALTKGCMP